MSEQDQDTVTTTTEQETELELNLDNTEDVDALKQKLAELEEAKRQITARAHKAEAEAKALKAKTQTSSDTQTINNNSLTEESVDVKILESQGVDSESIAMLKDISKVKGISLLAAQHNDIYKTWKSNQEATAKAEKAKLGASRGSGSAKVEKAFTSAGLSDEDHKSLWLKSQGR